MCVCGCVHMHVCVCLCTKGIPSWVLTRTKVIDKPSLQASYRQAPANSAHLHARSTNVNRISSPGYTRLAPQTCPHKAPKMRLNSQIYFQKIVWMPSFPLCLPFAPHTPSYHTQSNRHKFFFCISSTTRIHTSSHTRQHHNVYCSPSYSKWHCSLTTYLV